MRTRKRVSKRFSVSALRWLIPIFLSFWIIRTGSNIGSPGASFYILGALSVAGCMLLLSQLNRPPAKTVWIWVVLFTFMAGYYSKLDNLASAVASSAIGIDPTLTEISWVTGPDVQKAFFYTCIAFLLFCIIGSIAAGMPLRSRTQAELSVPSRETIRRRRLSALLWTITTLLAVTALLQMWLNIGLMGTETVHLPFRLDTVIIRLKHDVLISLLVLCIWLADLARWRGLFYGGVAVLFMNALIDSALTTTRGAVASFALRLLLLWVLTGRLSKGRIWICTTGLVMTVVLFPFISLLRSTRLQTRTTLVEALEVVYDKWSLELEIDSIPSALSVVSNRTAGAESLVSAVRDMPNDFSLERVKTLLLEGGLGIYFTKDVVGVRVEGDFRAPSLVGACLLIGGPLAGCLGLVSIFCGLYYFWRWCFTLRTGPAAASLFAGFLLGFVSEGTLMIQSVIAIVACLICNEWIYRRFLRRRRTVQSAQVQPSAKRIQPFGARPRAAGI